MHELHSLWIKLEKFEKVPNDDLRYIINYVGMLREVAGKKLLNQNPTNNDLRYIVRFVEPLRKVATARILDNLETIEDVMAQNFCPIFFRLH